MNIGIISDRLNRPLTGVGNYLLNLIENMKTKEDIYLISYEKNPFYKDFKEVIMKNPLPFLKGKPHIYFWHIYMQYKLPHMKEIKLDILHSPENSTLFRKFKNIKKVVTVHDMILYIFGEIKNIIDFARYRFLMPRVLKTADRIIAVSNNTKRDLISYLGISEEKIEVIYEGVSKQYKPLDKNEVKIFKKKYHLEEPFILYVGSFLPHKNIPALIKAFYKLKNQYQIKNKLVLCGKKEKLTYILKLIKRLNLQKDIIFTRYIPTRELPYLYNAADLFVYPSLYEGFGLPPLEAMACGTPVITSNTSSLPEVVGDAGIMIDPHDVDELTKTIYEVLTDEKLRKELSNKGLKRVKKFSWEKTAKETLKVYEEVYDE
ncbi:MAG TPA: glycosyltransferase family 1 protein [Thermoplasmata archaeon]|nr:glycosyltransferase family 1 protein [Thermoplasmata archaeon]